LCAFIALAILLAVPLPAAADTATYTLLLGNANGLCRGGSQPYNCAGQAGSVQPPYATVTLALSADSKTITVTDAMQGNYALWGRNPVFAFNYDGPGSLFVSDISSNLAASGWSVSTSARMGGFGTFDYALKDSAGRDLGSTLSFMVTRSNGGTFTSVSELVSGTYPFALHLASTASGGVTGFAGGGMQTAVVAPVPEPASLAMLGSGLLALGGYMRKRRSQRRKRPRFE
jgi:hypothetical protein